MTFLDMSFLDTSILYQDSRIAPYEHPFVVIHKPCGHGRGEGGPKIPKTVHMVYGWPLCGKCQVTARYPIFDDFVVFKAFLPVGGMTEVKIR